MLYGYILQPFVLFYTCSISYLCMYLCVGISAGASKESRASTSPLIINGKVHLPFQLQVRYTDRDGSRCMRVSTFSKPVTSDKKTADESEFSY